MNKSLVSILFMLLISQNNLFINNSARSSDISLNDIGIIHPSGMTVSDDGFWILSSLNISTFGKPNFVYQVSFDGVLKKNISLSNEVFFSAITIIDTSLVISSIDFDCQCSILYYLDNNGDPFKNKTIPVSVPRVLAYEDILNRIWTFDPLDNVFPIYLTDTPYLGDVLHHPGDDTSSDLEYVFWEEENLMIYYGAIGVGSNRKENRLLEYDVSQNDVIAKYKLPSTTEFSIEELAYDGTNIWMLKAIPQEFEETGYYLSKYDKVEYNDDGFFNGTLIQILKVLILIVLSIVSIGFFYQRFMNRPK